MFTLRPLVLANIILVKDLSLSLIFFPKGKLPSPRIINVSVFWWIDVDIRVGVISVMENFCHLLFLNWFLDLYSVYKNYDFFFFLFSISEIVFGLDRVDCCICNPVLSTRLVRRLTFVLFVSW